MSAGLLIVLLIMAGLLLTIWSESLRHRKRKRWAEVQQELDHRDRLGL